MVRRLSDGTLFVGEVVAETEEKKPEIVGDQFLVEDTAEEIAEPAAEIPAEKPAKKPTATKRKSPGKTKRK